MFTDLVEETIKRIEATEGRTRSRDAKTQASFEHAVMLLLLDLWKSAYSNKTLIRQLNLLLN